MIRTFFIILILSLLSNCAKEQSYKEYTDFPIRYAYQFSCDQIADEIEKIIAFQKTNNHRFIQNLEIDSDRFRKKHLYRKKIQRLVQKRLQLLNNMAHQKNCL